MNILVVGLGSMGKRRIRCLQALGYYDIYGLDLRKDRCDEAERKYSIKTTQSILGVPSIDLIFICTPPDKHHEHMKYACNAKIKFFVEHGILISEWDGIDPQYAYPSCTMLFHPSIVKLKQEMQSGELGGVSNVIYHSGQYLPDWHPYEPVQDSYFSKKETGGAREIVPFELTWIVDLFGMPEKIRGSVMRTIIIPGAELIDDTYNCLVDWNNFGGVMIVDVVSKTPIRHLTINTDKATIELDLNKNKSEQMYIDETKAFLRGVLPNTIEKDMQVLRLLETVEMLE